MRSDRRNAFVALTAAGLLWGTTVPLSKVSLEWLPPAWLTVVRFGMAAAILLPACRGRLRAACTPAVLVAGALGYGGSVLLQNAGIAGTSVSHAALLIGAVPVLVAIIAAVWHRTVARPVAWIGFAVSLAGVGLITSSHGGGASAAGDLLVLASLLLSSTVTVAQSRLLLGRDPMALTAMMFVGATVAALPIAMATEPLPAAPASLGPALAVLGLAAAGTLLPFTLFLYGQKQVSSEIAGAFVNLEPFVGAVAGVLLFGNPAGPVQLAGGAAILIGIGLSSFPAMRRPAPAAAAGAGPAEPAGRPGLSAARKTRDVIRWADQAGARNIPPRAVAARREVRGGRPDADQSVRLRRSRPAGDRRRQPGVDRERGRDRHRADGPVSHDQGRARLPGRHPRPAAAEADRPLV
jgi:O-acetylserine/cysteine efflux transporter